MELSISSATERRIEDCLQRGGFHTVEEVIVAGLDSMERESSVNRFGAGELDRLIAEGERSIAEAGVKSHADVFDGIRRRLDALDRSS